jgi:hypothetical protein
LEATGNSLGRGTPAMKHLAGVIGLTFLILLAVVEPSSCETNAPEDRARAFLTRFLESNHAFDLAVAYLYADEARIVSVRKYPNGMEQKFEMKGAEYKSLIREVMPLAKARADTNTYADISYQGQGTRVWIHATRYSAFKQYSSPYSLLVGPDASGTWLVYEERSVTRP